MVQFGKTLNDVVKSDWRCHAVAYMELKRALSDGNNVASDPAPEKKEDGQRATGAGDRKNADCGVDGVDVRVAPAANNEANNDDVHSVHTESSYCISDAQKANFFRIYEDSVARLEIFYEGKVWWAREERGILEKAVDRRIADDKKETTAGDGANVNEGAQPLKTNEDDRSSSSSTSFLIHRINNFSRDLGLVLEFLELNATAFRKIMKKFDKRTGSYLLGAKLRELKERHPYLYDGGELRECKKVCAEWIKGLQLILQQDSRMVAARLKGPLRSSSLQSSSSHASSGAMGLTVNNSLVDVGRDRTSKRTELDDGENPQESAEMKRKDSTPKTIVRFEGRKKEHGLAPGSIRKTRDFMILQNMIDRVNEELCLQKADSPFFDKILDGNPPPSFVSSEVELAGALGQGEFCKIFEVSKFNVPESCHICFLHRGFNDPESSHKLVLPNGLEEATHQHTITSAAINKLDTHCSFRQTKPAAVKDDQISAGSTQAMGSSRPPKAAAISKKNAKVGKVGKFFSFDYDANISDYDELESDHEDDNDNANTTRGFMKDHCLRNGEARYAIKRIRSNLVGREEITDAVIDLAREAEFLAALKHPNVIRIRGTIGEPGHPKYSLILDRLYDTLEVQMRKWKADKKRYRGKFKGLIGRNKMMLKKLWMDRLVASYDLARAMAYLHSQGILHRDIKPANIGFDIRGDIKIFDFGLAKELKPSEREGEDKYHTDGLAGTRRYMAPEMVQVMPYGLSADVYSFGILMWEMLTLKAAFAKHNRERHYKEVIVEGNRPKVSKSWPFVIKNLLERCWHKVPLERPTFQSICGLMKFGFPDDNVDVSGRSDDLLLRSYRSNHGRLDDDSSQVGMDTEHEDGFSNGNCHLELETPSDSLSQSVRIKSLRHNHNAVSAKQSV